MDHQRAAIAHVGQVAEELERLDEGLALAAAALQVEAEHRAAAARQQPLRQRMVGVAGQLGVGDAGHHRVRGEKLDDAPGVVHMPSHAQRQRLDALQDQPGGVRAHAGAEVAQALAPGAQQEGTDGAFLSKAHAVEAGVRFGQLRKTARGVPVELAAVHQHATHHRAVTAQKLGGRVVHQVSAMLKRLHQPGRGEGAVHQQRQAGVVRDLRHVGNVQHVQPRVAQGLAEQEPRLGPDGGPPGVQVARVDKGGGDAEARQRVVQQVVRAAVQRTAGHDVRAGTGQRADGQVQRRLAAGGGDAAHTAFQRGHALFEHGGGRVADAAVHMARPLHVEERGGLLAALEHEGGAEVDGQRAGACGRIGRGAGMQRQGVESGVQRSGHAVSLNCYHGPASRGRNCRAPSGRLCAMLPPYPASEHCHESQRHPACQRKHALHRHAR